jgi:hypothetical protein
MAAWRYTCLYDAISWYTPGKPVLQYQICKDTRLRLCFENFSSRAAHAPKLNTRQPLSPRAHHYGALTRARVYDES